MKVSDRKFIKVALHKSDSGWAWIPKIECLNHDIQLLARDIPISDCSVKSFWLHWFWFDVGAIWGFND